MPLLVLLLHIEPASATGLALGVVAASSIYGSIQRIRHREILWIPALTFGISGVVAAPVGRMLSTQVSPTFLIINSSVLSGDCCSHVRAKHTPAEQSIVVRANSGSGETEPLLCRFSKRKNLLAFSLHGWINRGRSTDRPALRIFGVGGGFMIMPFLTQLNSVSMRNGVATSLVIIAAISAGVVLLHTLTQAIGLATADIAQHGRYRWHGIGKRIGAGSPALNCSVFLLRPSWSWLR
ncbi:MAG: sulfite exporter TauE/SafE family protein [Haliea sp.]|nr:sulfite exporter TauE/SafE family protein [Haliea sp.]